MYKCMRLPKSSWGCPLGVVTHELDSDIVASEFEHSLPYNVHFWTNNLGKDINLLITQVIG